MSAPPVRLALALVLLLPGTVGCGRPPNASDPDVGPDTQLVRLVDRVAEPVSGVELSDVHRPVIPGAQRLEIPLPGGLAELGEGLTFETWLALAPEHQRPGLEARFRVWIEDRAGRRPVLEQNLGGGEEGPHGLWHPVAVPVALEGRGRIVLESAVLEAGMRGGTPVVPPEAALWGDPRIRTGLRQPGPNLLVIAVDTLRADVLGAWGDPHGLTPSLDDLAVRSVRFADLTAPSPWTLPSFATLLTGLPPEVHGAGRRLAPETPGVADNGISRLPSEVLTLAEMLGAAGFETASRYNNVYLRPTFGIQQGFDEHRGFHFKTRAPEVVDEGIRWLREHRERRFFLFLHVLDPHTPYFPPRETCREVARRLVPEPPPGSRCRVIRTAGGEDVPRERRSWAEALYRAEVAFTDLHLGRLLDALDELDLAANTVVLFVSDHGEELWESQEAERRYGYEPVADHGHSLYRELLHVPAALYVPEELGIPGWKPGVWEEPVELADFFPTLLGLLGVESPAPERIPGRDLGAGGHGELADRVRLAGFLRYGPPRVSVRRGPWKLIVPMAPGASASPELYHLGRDPGEDRNLAAIAADAGDPGPAEAARELGALRRVLRRELAAREELRRALDLPQLGERARPDGEQLDSLKALGYVD